MTKVQLALSFLAAAVVGGIGALVAAALDLSHLATMCALGIVVVIWVIAVVPHLPLRAKR
jgi:hypothetical protein